MRRTEGKVASSRPWLTLRRGATVAVVVALVTPLVFLMLSAPIATPTGAAVTGIQKIQHVIMISQENRSFDSYFGTYPGADGIPMTNGKPTVCAPQLVAHLCVRP